MKRLRPFGAGLVALTCAGLWAPAPAGAQEGEFEIRMADGSSVVVPLRSDRGYAVVQDRVLERLGWRVQFSEGGLQATLDRDTFVLRPDSPFFRWNGELLQLVSAPYASNGAVWIPVQLLLDFFPERMTARYAELGPRTLGEVPPGSVAAVEQGQREAPAARGSGTAGADDARAEGPPTEPPAEENDTPPAAASGGDPTWGFVVIDPGHGGRDPGALGPGGRREKDVALAVGRALARELGDIDGLEVRMTRDRDLLIPIWERGHLATEWKGDRPGIFISIHTNSVDRSSVRGFETYFLSEARTEHEARVAENENAPLALRGDEPDPDEPGLDFILRDLRNRDYQNRSAVLAEEIQRGLERIHPGPNRGVKQAPLAVITNALMPAVLVEVGFITNPNEERLLSRGEFQRELAREIAGAVERFFARYPAGAASGNRP